MTFDKSFVLASIDKLGEISQILQSNDVFNSDKMDRVANYFSKLENVFKDIAKNEIHGDDNPTCELYGDISTLITICNAFKSNLKIASKAIKNISNKSLESLLMMCAVPNHDGLKETEIYRERYDDLTKEFIDVCE